MGRPRTVSDAEALSATRACVVEQGPGVSLAVIAARVGLSAPALIKRFGSKEQLLFRALLPPEPPPWRRALARPPGDDPHAELADILAELARGFEAVGPALAALRMSGLDVGAVFPIDRPGPPVLVRALLARWLEGAGERGDCEALADAAVGAAEARGFLAWVGPQMIDDRPIERWAADLVAAVLAHPDEPIPRASPPVEEGGRGARNGGTKPPGSG